MPGLDRLRTGAAERLDHLLAEPLVNPDVRAVVEPYDQAHGLLDRQVPSLGGGDDHAESSLHSGRHSGGLEAQGCCLAGQEVVEPRPLRLPLDGEEDGLLLAAAEPSGNRKRPPLGNRELQPPSLESLVEKQGIRRAALAA